MSYASATNLSFGTYRAIFRLDLRRNGADLSARWWNEYHAVNVGASTSPMRAALMQAAMIQFGRLDIFVANARIPERKAPIHQLDLAG